LSESKLAEQAAPTVRGGFLNPPCQTCSHQDYRLTVRLLNNPDHSNESDKRHSSAMIEGSFHTSAVAGEYQQDLY